MSSNLFDEANSLSRQLPTRSALYLFLLKLAHVIDHIEPGGGHMGRVSFTYQDGPVKTIFPLEAGQDLDGGVVVILTPFNGTGASLKLGTSTDDEALLAAADINPALADQFNSPVIVPIDTANAIILTIDPGTGATAGDGYVFFRTR